MRRTSERFPGATATFCDFGPLFAPFLKTVLWPHVIAPKTFSLLALPGVKTLLLVSVKTHFSGARIEGKRVATDHFAKMGAQKKKPRGGVHLGGLWKF